jgi:hypothetical protein
MVKPSDLQKIGNYRRNGSDEHDGASGCTFSGVIRGESGDDSTDDSTDVKENRKVGGVL